MSDASNVTRLTLGEREFIIVGTAHVSRDSVDEVVRAIEDEKPDRVCVEIDQARHRSLVEKRTWESLDIFRVIKERKGFLLLGNLVLSSFQKRMGAELGVTPGEEMLAAINEAERLGIPTSFVDREIHTTLRRAWRKSGFWGKNKMLAALLSSVLSNETVPAEEIEALKESGALEGMMGELAAYLPSAKSVLIDERDQYLAARSYEAEGSRVLMVVGAGHVPGIVSWLGRIHEGVEHPDLDALTIVPPPSFISRALPWIIPALVLSLIVWGFIRSGWDGGMQTLLRWFLVNGTLSGIGAIVALAHPLNIIVSFLAAPFTSMNPTIGVGFVSGLLEAVLRKPRVIDFENLQDDITSLRGFYRNRITRVLLVFLFTTIGSAAGTFIALPLLF
ncbi:MAG: TraB/GumN family protein [Spirochaetaceae bacterium]|nr:MAG: TraB/GumN family protein [Spirochaetaceae bacterium]